MRAYSQLKPYQAVTLNSDDQDSYNNYVVQGINFVIQCVLSLPGGFLCLVFQRCKTKMSTKAGILLPFVGV